MDAETRHEIEVIHKRIAKLGETQECAWETITNTLEEIKTSILGKLDGGDGGMLPRMRRIETELDLVKRGFTTDIAAVQASLKSLEQKFHPAAEPETRSLIDFRGLTRGKLILILIVAFMTLLSGAGGWRGLKWLLEILK